MEPMDVLVVEDSPEYLQIVTSVLKQSGHRVRAATTIASAIESMASVPPDLVVLDPGEIECVFAVNCGDHVEPGCFENADEGVALNRVVLSDENERRTLVAL